jgi:hypothetical protein
MKALAILAGAAVSGALAVRVVRSRHRRFLHPDGRSFTGELEVWGRSRPIGSALVDRPGRYPVTVRISKGAGTRPGRPDVLGVAVRVAETTDLLLSTAGTGRLLRHVPVARRSFDTRYGSILAYRTGTRRKVYLSAEPDPGGPPLGRTLGSVEAAAQAGARLLLGIAGEGGTGGTDTGTFGRVTFGDPLPAGADAALAFDPIRNAPADLYPTGLIHRARAIAYPLSQRWRHAPGDADLGVVAGATGRKAA